MKLQAERSVELEGHEALTWLQKRTRKPQRCPYHSKIASPCRGAAQAVAKPGQVWAGLGTMEADRCRDIGGVRGRGSDWAQDRKLPLPEPVKSRPHNPACAYQTPQLARALSACPHVTGSPFRVFPLTAPLYQQGLLLLTPPSRKSFGHQYLSVSEPALGILWLPQKDVKGRNHSAGAY